MSEKLNLLDATKEAIKQAIIENGVTVLNEPFLYYPAKLTDIMLSGEPLYVRPNDWLALPELTAGQQKIVGLHAVRDNDVNFVSFTVSGDYTVDWGDGSALEDFAAATTATHNYDYTDFDDTTLSGRGYRQAIITITPQDGEDLTSVNFNVVYTGAGTFYSGQFLDMRVVGQEITSLTVSGLNVAQRYLEIFDFIGSHSITDATSMFRSAQSLKIINIDFSTIEIANLTFGYCYGLKEVNHLDFSNVTSCNQTFQNCLNLEYINLDLSSSTSAGSMFNGANALTDVELIMPNIATAASMFSSCNSLARVILTGATASTLDLGAARLLTAEALNAFYTSVGTVGSGTLGVAGNIGVGGDDPSIATAKGWTVSGS